MCSSILKVLMKMKMMLLDTKRLLDSFARVG
jgi:hypothetical protein